MSEVARPSGRRRDREEAPTRFTLAPLLEAQVFTAGPGRLTCGVGGRDYSAGEPWAWHWRSLVARLSLACYNQWMWKRIIDAHARLEEAKGLISCQAVRAAIRKTNSSSFERPAHL